MSLLTLILALSLDVILGDPPNRFHSVAGMGALLIFADLALFTFSLLIVSNSMLKSNSLSENGFPAVIASSWSRER